MAEAFKPVALKRFAPVEEKETPEGRFWRKFQVPVVDKLVRLPPPSARHV
jgi:hypothetical protein